jgi:hypothetical protein
MAKDNSTGKDKEFYDLGKKIFDRLSPTEADEAWDELERAQKWNTEDSIRRAAQESAMQFIDDNNVTELGIMTLRKAYEIGFRAGMYAEQRKKND